MAPSTEPKRQTNHHPWSNERLSLKAKRDRTLYMIHRGSKALSKAWKIEKQKGPSLAVNCLSANPSVWKGSLQRDTASFLYREFLQHVSQWSRETKHYSSVSKMVTHPSYLRIIGMGRPVLPLLLRELEFSGDHWLIALNAITGEDPATPGSTFRQAVDAWIAWGKEKGHLR